MTGLLDYGQRDVWSQMDDGLRWYQREMAEAVINHLTYGVHPEPVAAALGCGATCISPKEIRSTLVVAATGLGKTELFSAVAGEWKGNILVLCHRDELIDQARIRLERKTGEWVQREKGSWRAELSTRIVVASIDTLRQPKRLERFPRDHFSLIIIDEAHHYVGNTYVRPLEYFKTAKVLGVTATPDRADEKALGQVFDHVSYVMDIDRGIDHGYLVPIRGQLVQVDEIDLTNVAKRGKDLAAGQLDMAMIKAAEAVVRETIRLEPERQGIAFFPGVKSAEYAAAKFNTLKPGSARFLSGETPPDERSTMVRDFRRGDFQYLCNCQVATEGFDAPGVSLIVMACPTLSRGRYTQMVGRGTRPKPGLVDRYPQKEADVVRREAIRTSSKPDLMVLDFVGNSGKHSLMTLEDILGGKYSDDERQAAKKIRKECNGDPRAALEAARAERLRLAAELEAKVKSRVLPFDPFRTLQLDKEPLLTARERRPIGPKQWEFLEKAGVREATLQCMSWGEADRMLKEINRRRVLGLCTLRQLETLTDFGIGDPNLSFFKARAALDYIKSKGWHSPNVDPKVLDRIVHYREPGQEG